MLAARGHKKSVRNTLRPRWPPQGVVNSPANVGESMTASYVYYHSTPPVLFNMRRINNSAQCSMKHEPSTVNGAVTDRHRALDCGCGIKLAMMLLLVLPDN